MARFSHDGEENISVMRKFFAYLIPVALCFAVGALGYYVQASALEEWYPTLVKSPLSPPAFVFPVVWSLLYLLMGISIGTLIERDDMSVVRLWLMQLLVNFLWSVCFFGLRSPLMGLVVILILDVMVFTYIIYAAGRRAVAAWLFTPYMLWLLMATYLNGYIYVNNRYPITVVEARAAAPSVVQPTNTNYTMHFTLPVLPYAADALAPAMSRETIDYHYGKHYLTYLNNVNRLIDGTRFERMTLEDIVRHSDGVLYNKAAQALNHQLFFEGLTPSQQPMPDVLQQRIERDFGSVEAMRDEFSTAATMLFGSGWVWLVEDKDGRLSIVTTPNAVNPLNDHLRPLMVIDVWEHAYYIDYRNRRADFVKAFWDIVDWNKVASRLKHKEPVEVM